MSGEPKPFAFDLDQSGDRRVLALEGSLATADSSRLHGALAKAFDRASPTEGRPEPIPVTLDLTGVDRLEGAGAALIVGHVARLRRNGGQADLRGADPQVARQLELYGFDHEQDCLKGEPACEGLFAQVGRAVCAGGVGLVDTLSFIGEVTRAAWLSIARPRSVPWGDVWPLLNRAGADGLPIVVLINFLVGFTIALSGAAILARYGANVFVAELVGLSIVRELGPLMTAIVVAGRSGASYAAELGTMKVGEEVDALRTMSLEPVRYLVVPRLLALVIAVPLLTVVADIVAVVGGALVALTRLDLTAVMFFGRLQDSLGIGDLVFGLVKSAVFAMAIGMIACQRGLRTRGGAAGVGASTTTAVVVALFLLVGINAGFAALAELMGW